MLLYFLVVLLEALEVPEVNDCVKILQLTDLHYGEGELQNLGNNLLVGELLDWEKPDLVVVTGDLVSGYAWKGETGWFERFHKTFVKLLEERHIPWAFVLGNHDIEGDLSGGQIVQMDRGHSLSLMGESKPSLQHDSNYYVIIKHLGEAKLVLWMMDTGNRDHCKVSGYDCLHQEQINWQRDMHTAMAEAVGTKLPGLAFMHIPPPEFIDLWNTGEAKGYRYEDVACWASGNGTISSMSGLIGVVAGHDHFNDYEGDWGGLRLYYGRKTGFGGIGPEPHFSKGGRVFLYNFTSESLTSWIRTENGEKMIHDTSMGYGHHPALCAESSGYSLALHHFMRALISIILVSLAIFLIAKSRQISQSLSNHPKDERFEI